MPGSEQEIKESKTDTASSKTPLVAAGKIILRNEGDVMSIADLSKDEVAILICSKATPAEYKSRLQTYNSANLSVTQTDKELPEGMDGLIMCPRGDITANLDDRRVLIDPYTIEVKKDVGERIDFWGKPEWKNRDLTQACPINDDQYIVLAYEPMATAIKVYDSNTHEHKATLDNRAHPAMFFLPAPKNTAEKIIELIKLFSQELVTLQHFFIDNFDADCSHMLVDLRREMQKPYPDTVKFEKKLDELCHELEKFERVDDKKKYSEIAEKLNKLKEGIEKIRAEDVVSKSERTHANIPQA